MGCGNTKTDKEKTGPILTIYNPDHNTHNRNKIKKTSDTGFILPTNTQLEEVTKNANNKDAKNYLKLSEDAKTLKDIKWKDLIIDTQTYFDLLNAMNENENLETFSLESLEIQGTVDTMINLARTLMKKRKLKSLEFISLQNLGKKKAKSIAKIMEQCPLVERLILKQCELEESDAEFLGLILEKLSDNLIYFEISLVFFNTEMHRFLGGLQTNNTIQELILNKLNLSDINFNFLIKAISSNNCLRRLDVSNNPIQGGTSAFKRNALPHLHTLQLNNCSIDDESYYSLMDGIKESKSLVLLELNTNEITERSVDTVIMFFEVNKSLDSMYMMRNKICKRDLMSKLSESNVVKLVLEY
jgi:hypothetical protein